MQQNLPVAGPDAVLKNAFLYWSRTLKYQVLYSLIYFSFLFLMSRKLLSHYGLDEEFSRLMDILLKDPATFRNAMKLLSEKPELKSFTLAAIVAKSLLYPLNIGFFKIFRKMDLGEKPVLEDLFAGYLGRNFFIFFGFYLFWGIIAMYANSLVFPGILWVLATIFCAPLMFFGEKSIPDAIRLSFKGLRLKPLLVILGCAVAVFFSYSGFFLLLAGFMTYPFWNAMVYAMYRDIYQEANH